jgi:hypothetical protein
MSAPHTPSPTGSSSGSMAGPLESGVSNGSDKMEHAPTMKDVYSAENEVHTPTKEEMETNEKNLQQSAAYLGQLVFKLRFDLLNFTSCRSTNHVPFYFYCPYRSIYLLLLCRYKHDKNALIVSVVRCGDLPAKDPNLGSSDPYVKLQLLPDKQHKVKTRVLRKTRNPVYDEDFTFYGINFNQLPNITLHFVVLSFDRYSRDDIIGEVFCALNTVDITQIENQQMALQREIQPRSLKVSPRA